MVLKNNMLAHLSYIEQVVLNI